MSASHFRRAALALPGAVKQGYTNVRIAKADAPTLKSALTMAWKNVAPKASAKRRATKQP
jgi:hypothetical protein